MTLSEDLNTAAMKYAEHIASLGQMMHDPNLNALGHGENIYWAWSSTGTEINYGKAVEAWYNEINDPGYDFSNPGWTPGAGHFTQVRFKIFKMILTKSKLEYFIRLYGKHQLNLEWDMLLLMMEAFMLSPGNVRQIDSAFKIISDMFLLETTWVNLLTMFQICSIKRLSNDSLTFYGEMFTG